MQHCPLLDAPAARRLQCSTKGWTFLGFSKHGVVFTGGMAGTFTTYLDNLGLRHANGSTTVLWVSGKDTKQDKVEANELFKDIQVRAIDASQVSNR